MKFIEFFFTLFIVKVSSELQFEVQEQNFTIEPQNNSQFLKPHVLISGGSSAQDRQFPFVAEIRINVKGGQLLCTGSLISRDWIVSARHCIAE